MDAKDWYEAGAKIGELVQSAIDRGDFQQLSEKITVTIEQSAEIMQKSIKENIQRGMSGSYRYGGNAYHDAKRQAFRGAGSYTPPEDRMTGEGTLRKLKTNFKGIASMLLGYAFAGINGFLTLLLVFGVLIGNLGDIPIGLFFAGLTALGVFVGHRGRKYRKRLGRLQQYLHIMGKREAVTVSELAAGTGQSESVVREDLRILIKDGVFEGAAYLDDREENLMLTAEAYRQYQETMREYEKKQAEAMQASYYQKGNNGQGKAQTAEQIRNEAEKNLSSYSEETKHILQQGRSFIQHIHECNDLIPGEMMTEKLSRLEMCVTRIFDQVAKNPDSAPDMDRVMEYYLPVTSKLVDAYVEIQDSNLDGTNVSKTRREIEKSLDTINEAFENLLDSFYQDTAWDITSDISAMTTMMARDGLTGRGEFGRTRTVSRDVQRAEAEAGVQTAEPEPMKSEAPAVPTAEDQPGTLRFGNTVVGRGGGAAAMVPMEEERS